MEGWEDYRQAVEWARTMLTQDFRILDTETTGLGNAEIVEIAIIDLHGEPLVNSLVRPSIPIPPEATEIHGITPAMVETAPTLSDIWGDIQAAMPKAHCVPAGKPLVIYNRSFDLRILEYCRRLHDLPPLSPEHCHCLMLWYAQWWGAWNSYYQDYRWQKLIGGGHRALGDCRAALAYLHKMAEIDPDPAPEPDDPLDCIPF